MLHKDLEEKLSHVDVITDFDRTMVQETLYLKLFSYFLFLPPSEKSSFLKKTWDAYRTYEQTGDIPTVYSLFEGCPVWVLDRVVPYIHRKEGLISAMHDRGFSNIGILSRNDTRTISKYVDFVKDSFPELNFEVIIANELEVNDNVCTGRIKLNVTDENLKDYVFLKPYIGGKDEAKILKPYRFKKEKIGRGLFLFNNL